VFGRTLAAVLVGAAVLVACGEDPAAPIPKVTASIDDPIGDTFGGSANRWDITAFAVTQDSGGVDVAIDFSVDPISAAGHSLTATFGFVEFDTDQDSTTGIFSRLDVYRPDTGSAAMGVDYIVTIGSSVSVSDAFQTLIGTIKPTFQGKRLSFRVPRNLIGSDDGFLNAVAIFGIWGEPTDIVPNYGHLQVGETGPVAPTRSGAARLTAGTWFSP
jgi:hypothetical protein